MFHGFAFWKKWRITVICCFMCVFSIVSLILGIREDNFEWNAVLIFLFFFVYLLIRFLKHKKKNGISPMESEKQLP